MCNLREHSFEALLIIRSPDQVPAAPAQPVPRRPRAPGGRRHNAAQQLNSDQLRDTEFMLTWFCQKNVINNHGKQRISHILLRLLNSWSP